VGGREGNGGGRRRGSARGECLRDIEGWATIQIWGEMQKGGRGVELGGGEEEEVGDRGRGGEGDDEKGKEKG